MSKIPKSFLAVYHAYHIHILQKKFDENFFTESK